MVEVKADHLLQIEEWKILQKIEPDISKCYKRDMNQVLERITLRVYKIDMKR